MSRKPRLYNLTRLYEIENADENFIRQFVEVFLENVPRNCSELAVACDKKDWSMVYFLAHKIKANVDLAGIDTIKTDLHVVELYAKSETHTNELPKKVKRIQTIIEKVSQQLKEDFFK